MKNVCIRRSRPKPMTPKQQAKREAAGETFFGSSIARSAKPKKLNVGSHSRPDAKQKRRKPVKPIKKENPERQAKRRKRYSTKLAAYRRSETFKVVEKRANGRCERQTRHEMGLRDSCGYPRRDVQLVRCHETEGLQHHHLGYARFGGGEIPTDIQVLCPRCHAIEEAKHPTRRNGRRSNQQRNAS